MRVSFRYQLELPGDADLAAIEDAGAAALGEHGDLVGQGQAAADRVFTVVGVVKGKPAERWRETVRAQDPAEAEAKAQALAPEGTEYSIGAVMKGEIPVESEVAQ